MADQLYARTYTHPDDSTRDTVWKKPQLYRTEQAAKRGMRGWKSSAPGHWYVERDGGSYAIQPVAVED